MDKGRNEMFAVTGDFSKEEFSLLKSRCELIDERLKNKYEKSMGNDKLFFIQSYTRWYTGRILGIKVSVCSTAAIAVEGMDELKNFDYETGPLIY